MAYKGHRRYSLARQECMQHSSAPMSKDSQAVVVLEYGKVSKEIST